MNIGLNLWKAYMNIRNDVNNDDIDRWISMGDIAIRRAQNLEPNFSEDEKLKLEVAITLIKNVMNLMSELRIGANPAGPSPPNPAVAGPSMPTPAVAGPSIPTPAVADNQSNIAQDCKDTALTLWRAYQAVLSGRAVDDDDINRYVEMGHTALLHVQNSSQNLSVSDKQKLQAGIALINSILHRLSERRVGAGLNENNAAENNPAVVWDDVQSAFENRIKTGVITNRRHLDLLAFMKDAKKQFIVKVTEALETHPALKVNTVLAAEYTIVKDDEETVDIKYFNTKTASIYSTTDLNEWFVMNVQQPIDTEMEEFQERESGWSLKSILNLVINIYKYNPMRGSSFIDLPLFIKNKKACINVKNDDDQCFRWAILSALHPNNDNINRVGSYVPYKNELNFEGIEFPVDPQKIGKFEKQNEISVNVYYLKKKGKIFDILPRHLTSCKKEKHVNLLLVESHYVDEDEDEEETRDSFDIVFKNHYVWIKNLSRLCSRQLSARVHKTFICDRCLHYFWTEDKLLKHTTDCKQINQCKITLPSKKDNILQFKNFGCKNRVPFVIYADFECILEPVTDNDRAYQSHKPFSVGFFVKCSYNNSLSEYKSYRQEGEDAESPAKWFVQSLHSLAVKLNDAYKNPRPMNDLTPLEQIKFDGARICHICEMPFTDIDKRVRDHCHFTGK